MIDATEQIVQADGAIRAVAPNFSYYELTTTRKTDLLDANREQGIPYLPALLAIAGFAQVIRDKFGPVGINSGFRGDSVNSATKGASKTSQHKLGEAIDIRVPGHALADVFNWIRNDSGIKFGQLILEGSNPGEPTWIHISLGAPWRTARKCGQVMTWDSANGYKRVE